MQKLKTGLCLILCMTALTACGARTDAEETSVTIDKKGKISGVIVEEFTQEYYDKEDLKNYTLQETAVFNAAHGENAVTLTKLDVQEEHVIVQMEYASPDDYAAFNSTEFFAGTIAEAYEEGYPLDVTLNSVAEPEKTIGKNEILGMGEKHVVIAKENILYRLPSKALYVSRKEEVIKSTAVRRSDGSLDSLLYIIY